MAYGEFKDKTRRTVSDKILRDKAFNINLILITKNSKYYRDEHGLTSMVY